MADPADVANDHIDFEFSRVLKARRDATQTMGSKMCKECGEQMPEARRNLGFQLCIECAEDAERRKALFAGY